jgi:hypothetical protein
MQKMVQPAQAEKAAVPEDVVALAAALFVAARSIAPIAIPTAVSQWAAAARQQGVRG